MSEIDKILEDRGSRYGDFGIQSKTAQAIRDAFKASPNWKYLAPYMREGLDLVATKISRMLCGDPMYLDNVVDILGYMTLVKEQMEKEHAGVEAFAKRAGVQKEEPMPWDTAGIYMPAPSHAADNKTENPYKVDVVQPGNPLGWKGPYDNS